jgi:RNA-directed DNA polymerase
VVQAALVAVLEPIFDREFSEHSHGFRHGHSAHGALDAVLGHLNGGRIFVVDADLKGYFASIPHERLLALVARKVTDGRILNLIGAFLRAGIMEHGTSTEPQAGTPQGGVISPLLANLYLDELDHLMADSGVAMERHADDFVICCRTQAEAESVLIQVREWTAHVGPTLHPTKTRIVDLGQAGNHIDFLGFRLERGTDKTGRSRIFRKVRPPSLDRIKEALRERTRRTDGSSLTAIATRPNPVLRGWFAYFRSAVRPTHALLDKLIRRRLRACSAGAAAGKCRPGVAAGISGNGPTPSSPNWGSSLWRQPRPGTPARIAAPTDGRAVCGKTARTVRREGRPDNRPSLPLSSP